MKISDYEIAKIEYILSRMKNQYRPLESIQLARGVYVINVPVTRAVQGIVNGKKNMLVYNFWELTFGLIAGSNPVSIFGAYKMTDSAYLKYGAGTQQTTFGMNGLQGGSGSISTQLTIATMSDRTRISAVGVLPSSAYEIGLIQDWTFIDPPYNGSVMYGRVTGTFNANTTITYYVDFLNPWTQNIAQLVFSFFTNGGSVNVVDVTGTTDSVTYGSAKGSATLIGSQSSYTWSPKIYNVSQDVAFSTYHNFQYTTSYVVDYILGTYQPSSQITIQNLSLIQNYNGYDLLLLVLPLSSPITLVANQQNYVYLRLVAE